MLHEAEIPIPPDLQALFQIPACSTIALPDAKPMQLRLPNGASLTAIADLSKGVPTDCSMATSLIVQLAPFLASIECLLKLLAVIEPLIKFVKAVPSLMPQDIISASTDLIEAAAKLAPCIGMIMPATPAILFFIKDLLLIIIRMINCMIGSLETILGIMQGIELRLEAANAAGNTELAAVLECARENAATAAAHAQSSLGPVQNIMPLIMSFLELAGVSFELPAIGSAEDAAALAQTIQTLRDTITSLETVVETLP
jgi:hypothetical protein